MSATGTMPLRVWPACLSHYNSGVLVGAWVDASAAGDFIIAKLHELVGAPLLPDCKEVWYLAGDGPWPDFYEMGIQEAQEWSDAYAEVKP